ncbi:MULTISPECIES: M1 family metallopeptidase [Actinomadura]|uniref:Aminopeptidase N n=1 Tax=Actinomadura yumaensis TaxID=111807 RepID=A0ABW2C926_9ACTN|nr:M1 family metallopeptidase [Actinomadura sp. J1-007]MWK33953.1 M1 family peptidase [Actinomadura sp. J1-007]
MNGPRGRATALVGAAALLASWAGAAAASAAPAPAPKPARGVPGAPGAGDRYFANAGNGGYDVAHYDIALTYKPLTAPTPGRNAGRDAVIDAAVTITARATQRLSRFDLDFRGPRVSSVLVNGRRAAFRREGQELVVTPAAALPSGAAFTVRVRYAGRPRPMRSAAFGTYGWVPTRDGAVVLAEPDGAPTWFPANDHPSDKATYAFDVTVPKGLRVLASGRPAGTAARGAATAYRWVESAPMASYLAMIAIGRFTVRRSRAGSVPVITAVDPGFARAGAGLHRTTVRALTWATGVFGPYPFATAGGIVDDPPLDYALETQERPVYAGFAPDAGFVVHELAHQWFGGSVSLARWQDVWLNEGFATYAEWMWREHTGGTRARTVFRRYLAQPPGSPVFTPPPGRPERDSLFGLSVYVRGAMCLQALRERVGDEAFFTILRTWAAERRGSNATTPQFTALAERVAGRDLGPLFNVWLYTKGRPSKW